MINNKMLSLLILTFITFYSLFSLSFSEQEIDSLLKYEPEQNLNIGKELIGQEKYNEALAYYLEYWKTNMKDATTLYNIACLYGLTGNSEKASAFLLKSVEYGMTDYSSIEKDVDFTKIKNDTLFVSTLKKIKNALEKNEKLLGSIGYVQTEVKLRYRIILPENYNPQNKYTLLVGLHGYGGSNKQFIKYSQFIKNENIIYVCPQAPYPFENSAGKLTSFSWTVPDFEENINRNHSSELSTKFVLTVIEDVKKKYAINAVYLTGFSQGGFMTFGISLHNPKIFDGAISFGGGLREDWITTSQIKKAKNLPFLIVHGLKDNVVPYDNAQKAYNLLTKYGYNVTLSSFNGGHFVSKDEFVKAIEWIKNNNKLKGL